MTYGQIIHRRYFLDLPFISLICAASASYKEMVNILMFLLMCSPMGVIDLLDFHVDKEVVIVDSNWVAQRASRAFCLFHNIYD